MTEPESDKANQADQSLSTKIKLPKWGFPGLALSALIIGAGVIWFGAVTVNQFCNSGQNIDMFSPKSVSQIEKQSSDSLTDRYLKAGQYERVIQILTPRIDALKKFGKADPFLADSELKVGKSYLMLGKYAEAKTSYEDAIAIYKKLGNYKGSPLDQAEKDYDEVIKHLKPQASQ